jgi:hypothetical protein
MWPRSRIAAPLDEEVESEAYGRAIKLWRFAQLGRPVTPYSCLLKA